MTNATKNLIKKRDANIQKEKKKIKAKQKRDKINIDIILSTAIFAYLFIFTLIAVINKSNSFGFFLTVMSYIVTISFEGYEWFFLFYKNKEKKHALMPCMLSVILIMIFAVITVCFFNDISAFESFEYNNLLCAILLLIYIFFITLRKIIEDLRS